MSTVIKNIEPGIAMRIEGVSKQYKLGTLEPYKSVRDAIANLPGRMFKNKNSLSYIQLFGIIIKIIKKGKVQNKWVGNSIHDLVLRYTSRNSKNQRN